MPSKKVFKTIIAPLKFNLLANLTTDELLERGHIPMGITVRAQITKADKSKQVMRFPIPKEVGTGRDGKPLRASKSFYTRTEVNKIWVQNLSTNGIEKLKAFLKGKEFKNLSFVVEELVTESKETRKWVTWKRRCIKNGTRAKALVVDKIDDKPFTELDYSDVVSVTDDMFFDACQYEAYSTEYVTPECVKH